uniref:MYND-type domain-containing protein n=1 Tax=Timema genevievae TaxID=629358 RepID=A0A7R9JU70_TIMGE|nr:unnamed protein product [Timema genevievae]
MFSNNIFSSGHLRKSNIDPGQLKVFSNFQKDEDRFSFVFALAESHKFEMNPGPTAVKDGDVAKGLKDAGNRAFQSGDNKSALALYNKSVLKTPWTSELVNTQTEVSSLSACGLNRDHMYGDKIVSVSFMHIQPSTCLIPAASRDLSVSVANRSAALYHLKQYQPALDDIAFVSTLDYPLELSYKVLDRKARCLLAMNQLKDALEAFKATLKALDGAKLPDERRMKWQSDIQIMIAMLARNKELTNDPLPPSVTVLPHVSGGRNKHYESASAAVTVCHSEEMGRYAVAATDIKAGHTVVVEKAYCSVLLAEHRATHCFHCFNRLVAVVPCPHCCNIAFCSAACQQVALSTHHRVECPVLEVLWESGASVTCLMALRILSQTNIRYFLDMREQLKQTNIRYFLDVREQLTTSVILSQTNIWYFLDMREQLKQTNIWYFLDMREQPTTSVILSQTNIWYFLDMREQLQHTLCPTLSQQEDAVYEPRVYQGSHYLSVYHLVRHHSHRSIDDWLQRTGMAVFLFRCLQVSGYFGEDSSLSGTHLNPDHLMVGGLLLRHLQSLQFNAHEISELQLGDKGESKSVFLGGGLYPTLALFNHSCNPGVTRYFRGTSVVVRTVATHRQGEMLAENYGPIFTQDPRAHRQATLREQYHFECVCAPCRQDWPKFEDMNPGLLRFRCDSGDGCSQVLEVAAETDQFMVQCPTCRGYTNILKGLKTLQNRLSREYLNCWNDSHGSRPPTDSNPVPWAQRLSSSTSTTDDPKF